MLYSSPMLLAQSAVNQGQTIHLSQNIPNKVTELSKTTEKEEVVLIQADHIKLSIEMAVDAFRRQALLIYYNNRKLPQIDPFQNQDFLRKQLTTLVEAKLIEAQCQKDLIQLTEEEEQKLWDPLLKELTQDPIFQHPTELRMLKEELLRQALVQKWVKWKISQIPEQEIEKEYLRQNTSIRILQAQIARIPSYQEIQEAKIKYQNEILEFYQNQQHRFTQDHHYKVNVVQISQQQIDARFPPTLVWQEQQVEVQKQDQLQRAAKLEKILMTELQAMPQKNLKLLCERYALKCSFEQLIKSANIKEYLPEGFDPNSLNQQVHPLITPMKFHYKDWRFYEILSYHAGFKRSLEDDRIQTEIASEILQQKNELPSTYEFAKQVKDFMEKLPISMAMIWEDQVKIDQLPENERKWIAEKKQWLKQKQGRLILTESFKQSPSHYTPKLGKSDPLHTLLFQMKVGQTSQIYPIRQVFAIAKLIEYQPPVYSWDQMRTSFSEKWRNEKHKSFIEQYLNEYLKDKKKAIHPQYFNLFPSQQISSYLDQCQQKLLSKVQ
jgi:hypothetical protein